MKRYLPWVLRLLGPALLIYFLTTIDFTQLLIILRQAKLWPIVLALILMPPFIWIKSWRWQQILKDMQIDLPLKTAIGLYTVGLFLGATTPGQAGDLVKAFYLRDRGAPLAPAMLSVVLDRLCDLLVMAVIASLSVFVFSQFLPDPRLQTALVVVSCVGILTATGLLLARTPREWLLSSFLPRILPGKLSATLARWQEQLNSLTLRLPLVLTMLVSSLISAGFTFWRLWLLFLALGLDRVPLFTVMSVSALIAVVQVLPISFSGIGVRDGILVAALQFYGYGTELAISLSLLFLLLNIEHIVVGFITSFWFPLGKAAEALNTTDTSTQEAPRQTT
jgi:uncharacterized protein (TIRG00374 family)